MSNSLCYGLWAIVIVIAFFKAYRVCANGVKASASWLEENLDWMEFQFDRTYGGVLDTLPGLKGHAAFGMLTFLVSLTFLVLGPNLFWKPGETVTAILVCASWLLGLSLVAWYLYQLLQYDGAGIRWISGLFIPAAVIAYFCDLSCAWPPAFLLIGFALHCFGASNRGRQWAPCLKFVFRWAPMLLAGSGLLAMVYEYFRGEALDLNLIRLTALVIIIGIWLLWARFDPKPGLLRPARVTFLIVVVWSLPLLCQTPWLLLGRTLYAAIRTWVPGLRPSFDENADVVAAVADERWMDAFAPHHATSFALALGLLAAISDGLSKLYFDRCLDSFRQEFKFHGQLNKLDLLEEPAEINISRGSLLGAIFNVLWETPIQALFLPAVFMLRLHHLENWPNTLILIAVAGGWWLLLALTSVHPELRRFRQVVDRFFFQRGQFALSLTLIVLGVLQLLGIQYVTVVVEAGGWWVARTFVFLYSTLWFYEYWINRSLSLRVWKLLKEAEAELGKVKTSAGVAGTPHFEWQRILDMTPPRDTKGVEGVSSAPESVSIQVHGSAKIAVVRMDRTGKTLNGRRKQRTFEIHELLETLVRKAGKQQLMTNAELASAAEKVRDIGQRIRGYFGLNHFLLTLTVALFVIVAWSMPGRPLLIAKQNANAKNAVGTKQQNPSGEQRSTANDHLVALRELMFPDSASGTVPPRRIILVAASGGGTRAALYTASVLDGLSKLDALDDVYLTSGVSGGGASLAYFAMHRDRLSNPEKPRNDVAWNEFHERMASPFIEEVLKNWWEFRTATGTSLGQLLVESFDRNFKSPGTDHETLAWCADSVANSHKLAVIWNTTLTGEFPASSSDFPRTCQQDYPVDKWGQRFHAQLASSYFSGGRLVLTNLRDGGEKDAFYSGRTAFPDAPQEYLKFAVCRDPSIRFSTAAALAANFPPVFPNAAVDVTDVNRRYWVTDGGTMDNRGILSLLLCLEQALIEQAAQGKPEKIPEIHVVVIEGSAMSFDYMHDRGTSAFSGARALIANQLMLQLSDRAKTAYRNLANDQKSPQQDIDFHYLTMPTTLRSRGGLGTHWMLPNEVTLTPTEQVDPECAQPERKTLTRKQLQELIRWLHPPTSESPTKSKTDSVLAEVQEWILNDSLCRHNGAWARLCTSLKKK